MKKCNICYVDMSQHGARHKEWCSAVSEIKLDLEAEVARLQARIEALEHEPAGGAS